MPVILLTALVLGDLFLLNASITASYLLVGSSPFGGELMDSIYLFIYSNIAWLFLIIVINPYSSSRDRRLQNFTNQIAFLFIHLLIIASLIFFFKRTYVPFQIALIYILFIPSFFLLRGLLRLIFGSLSTTKVPIRNVIIVGAGESVRELRKYFLMHPELNYRFQGYFSFSENDFLEIEEICRKQNINEIYCCLSDSQSEYLKKIIDFGLNALIRIKLVADYRPEPDKMLELELHDQIPVLTVSPIPLDNFNNQIVKRIFDFVFALTVTVTILSWLIPIVAIVIKLDSKGPVFFRQKRSGEKNRSFTCLKFRTMIVNKDAHAKQATKDDVRITRIGKFLRKTSLDEFPQFLNVLQGTMSIVGPRPHMLKHTEEYSKLVTRFMARHYVKPGITGLAQSFGYRGEIQSIQDIRNRIKLDRFYIENWSLAFDIKIILLTVRSILTGHDKAY